MPKRRTTTVKVDEDGRIQPRSRAEWLLNQWLPDTLQLFSDGWAVIGIEKPKRSLAQNRKYWGYLIRPIRKALAEAGHPISEKALHEHFKDRFLGVERSYEYTNPRTGEVKEIVELRSTTELDSSAFEQYCERIRESELVRELGIYLPRPDDPDWVFQEIDTGTVHYQPPKMQ